MPKGLVMVLPTY